MLDCSPELETFLNTTTQGATTGLVTITLRGGTVYRWARNKTAVTFGGTTWQPHGLGGRPLLSWGSSRSTVGLEISTLEVTLQCGDTAALDGRPLPLAAMKGLFDGARLRLERAYMATPNGAVVGTLIEFEGTVQSWPSTATTVKLTAESDIAKLRNQTLPKTLLSTSCQNSLYDSACGVSRAANTSSYRTVQTGSSAESVIGNIPVDAGWWDLGVLTFESGALAGERRSVMAYSAGDVYALSPPLPSVPVPGAVFRVTRGCNKTPGECAQKFNNLPRFRATPLIPKE